MNAAGEQLGTMSPMPARWVTQPAQTRVTSFRELLLNSGNLELVLGEGYQVLSLTTFSFSFFLFFLKDITAPRQRRLARRVTSGKGLKQRSEFFA